MARRLFVAVPLPEPVRRAVVDAVGPVALGADHLRWTDPAGWHVTVAFLGEVDPDALPRLCAALTGAVVGSVPFELALRPCASRDRRAQVLWIELEPCEPLRLLAARVDEAVRDPGLTGRRPRVDPFPFRPHITLARTRADGRVPRRLVDAYDGPVARWTVDGLALMESHLARPGGARYETLTALPFKTSSG